MTTYRTFPSAITAREYRHDNGTGGWIFEPALSDEPRHFNECEVILFPPDFTPSMIFRHPFTKGRDGMLIGN